MFRCGFEISQCEGEIMTKHKQTYAKQINK